MKLARLTSYILFTYVIIKLKVRKMSTVAFVFSLALLIIGAYYSTDKSIVYLLLMIFAAESSNSRRVIRFIMYIQLISLIVIVGSSIVGFLPDKIFDPQTRARHCLGFDWTTTPAMLLTFISLEYYYLRDKSIKLIELIVVIIANYLIYVYTDARMCFLIICLASLIIFLYRFSFNFNKKIMNRLAIISVTFPTIICIISLCIHAFYSSSNGLLGKLNSLLSGRLALGRTALDTYEISFFGQFIKWVGNTQQSTVLEYNYVDCSYLQILLSYGIVLLLFVICVYSYILYAATRKKHIYEIIIVTCVLVLSVTEPRLWNLIFNPFPFLIIDAMKKNEFKYRSNYEKV